MSRAPVRPVGVNTRAGRKGPHHVIVARGDKIRSFAIRRTTFVAAVLLVTLAITVALSLGVMSFFKEDPMVTSVIEQAEIRQDYEARIDDMNRQMDTVLSRFLVERATVNRQVDELVERQGYLVQQQQLLLGIAGDARAAGIDTLPLLAPVPLANPLRGASPPAAGIGGPIDPIITDAVEPDQNAGISETEALLVVAAAADWLEQSNRRALADLWEAIAERESQLAAALESLGVATVSGGIGGPFEPDPGNLSINNVTAELAEYMELRAFAQSLPLATPLSLLDVTSSYGRRMDPFLGHAAVHTGVDLRGSTGTVVRAAAPGTVITAGTNGGYGRMVEIDHGNGLVTGYAHLSTISVRVGQRVESGLMVGRVGSTGRSTGPHLHYEISKDGRKIDPMRYLLVGQELAQLL